LPLHPNGMQFCAYDAAGSPTRARTYYSVGGFVLDQSADGGDPVKADETPLRYPFWSAADLLAHCSSTGLPIDQVMLGNETSWRPAEAVRAGLLDLWAVMQDCVVRGTRNVGVLPGGLKGRRRAPDLARALACEYASDDPCGRWTGSASTPWP